MKPSWLESAPEDLPGRKDSTHEILGEILQLKPTQYQGGFPREMAE